MKYQINTTVNLDLPVIITFEPGEDGETLCEEDTLNCWLDGLIQDEIDYSEYEDEINSGVDFETVCEKLITNEIESRY